MGKHKYMRQGKLIGEVITNKLCKFGLVEKRHLLWQAGGVPCIDKRMWEDCKTRVKEIYVRTDKGRRFKISSESFEKNKKEVDFGHGIQYVVDKDFWDIAGTRVVDKQESLGLD